MMEIFISDCGDLNKKALDSKAYHLCDTYITKQFFGLYMILILSHLDFEVTLLFEESLKSCGSKIK